MATWYLMNNVKSGGTQFYAGTLIDDAITPTAPIVAVGGVILASATLGLAVAAPVALSFAREGDFAQAEKIMLEALKVGAGAATEATLASVLAKIIAAPATEAKQDANIDAIEDLQSATVYKYYAAFAADTNLVTDGGGLCRRVVVGKSGTLVLTKNDDTDETLPAEICTDGAVLDLRAKAIKNTSTATKVLVMW